MKYNATYISNLGDTLYENDTDTLLPVISKAQALMQSNIYNGNPTPDIIIWNTETENPVTRIWNDNGEVRTQFL